MNIEPEVSQLGGSITTEKELEAAKMIALSSIAISLKRIADKLDRPSRELPASYSEPSWRGPK